MNLIYILMLSLLVLANCKKSKRKSKSKNDKAKDSKSMMDMLQNAKDSGALGDVDMDTFNLMMQNAQDGYDVFAVKTEELEELKAKYQSQIEGVKKLHEEMSETQREMSREHDEMVAMRNDYDRMNNALIICQSDEKDFERERKGWEDTTSLFVQDIKIAHDVIQDEKKKARNCKKELQEIKKQQSHSSGVETDKLKSENEGLKDDIKNMKNAHEEELNELQTKNSETETDLRLVKASLEMHTELYKKKVKSMKESFEHQSSELKAKIAEYESKEGNNHNVSKKDVRIQNLEDQLNTERNEVNIILKSHKMEMTKLKSKIEELTAEIGNMGNGQLLEELQKLKEEHQSLQAIHTLTKDRYAELKEINTNTGRSVSHWMTKHVNCNRNNTKIATENAALMEDYEKLSMITDEKIQLNDKQKLAIEKLNNEIVQIQKKVDAADKNGWKEKFQTCDASSTNFKKAAEACSEEAVEYQSKTAEKVNSFIKEIEEQKEKLTHCDLNMKTVATDCDTVRTETTSQCAHSMNELNRQQEDNERKIDELNKENRSCNEKLNDIQKSVKLVDENDRTREKLRYDSLQSERDMYRQMNKEMGIEFSVCTKKLEYIQNALDARNKKIKEVSLNCSTLGKCEFSKNRTELLYSKALKECSCTPVTKTLEDGGTEIVEFKTNIESNCEDDLAEYKECSKELKEWRDNGNKLEGNINDLKKQLTYLKDKSAGENKKATTENARCKNTLKETTDKLAVLEGNVKSKDCVAIQEQVNTCEDKKLNCEETLKVLRVKSDKCQKDFAALDEVHHKMESEYQTDWTKLQDCQKNISNLAGHKNAIEKLLLQREEDLKVASKSLSAQKQEAVASESFYRWYFFIFSGLSVLLTTYIVHRAIKEKTNQSAKPTQSATAMPSRGSKREGKKRR